MLSSADGDFGESIRVSIGARDGAQQAQHEDACSEDRRAGVKKTGDGGGKEGPQDGATETLPFDTASAAPSEDWVVTSVVIGAQ